MKAKTTQEKITELENQIMLAHLDEPTYLLQIQSWATHQKLSDAEYLGILYGYSPE
jgi:hypothetical protein